MLIPNRPPAPAAHLTPRVHPTSAPRTRCSLSLVPHTKLLLNVVYFSVAPDTRPADTGGREMVSIHPLPLSSSSPLPRALHPKARCLDWQAKDFPQWKGGGLPPWGVGWEWGWGAHKYQLHLDPDPNMGFGCAFPGARRSITRGQPCLPRGCCCLFGLGGWSVGSWSPDRERTHNPASQVPSEMERAKPGLT